MKTQDESSRRAYWAEQMELGYALVEQTMSFEVQECGEGFVSIPEAAQALGVEMWFSESKIAGELDRVFYIREGLISSLMAAGRAMNFRGWVLKIEDGYRSQDMQSQLVRKPEVFDAILRKCIWENGGKVPTVEFVARRALVLVANLPKTGTHMSGSAIDISVFRREDGTELWRGGPYLEMSELTPMRSPFVTGEELENRLAITEVMEAEGFVHFPYEFWHFNKGDALGNILKNKPDPARYGPVHWNSTTNEVTPYEDPLRLLNPQEVMEAEIAASIERLG